MPQKSLKTLQSSPLPVPIPSKSRNDHAIIQESLPVTFRTGGKRVATLAEHRTATLPTLSMDQLTPEQWKALTIKRIQSQSEFQCLTATDRPLKRRAAIREVQQGTPIGQIFVEIEQALIRSVVSPAIAVRSTGSETPEKKPPTYKRPTGKAKKSNRKRSNSTAVATPPKYHV